MTLTTASGESFRWLPRHGQPSCVGEWISQVLVRCLAWAPLYTAVVVTAMALVYVFGFPFVEGR